MVLFLHNRYRTTGGEERVVEDLLALVRERLGEQAELLGRDSATLARAGAAAGLLRGGSRPEEVARASSCTYTSTGSSARSACASRAERNAPAATGVTRCRG
jgi:hypothetical protein